MYQDAVLTQGQSLPSDTREIKNFRTVEKTEKQLTEDKVIELRGKFKEEHQPALSTTWLPVHLHFGLEQTRQF